MQKNGFKKIIIRIENLFLFISQKSAHTRYQNLVEYLDINSDRNIYMNFY